MHRGLLGAALAGTSDNHPMRGGSPPGRVRILSTPCPDRRAPPGPQSGLPGPPAPPGAPPQRRPLSRDGVCSPPGAGQGGPPRSPRPDPGVVSSLMESAATSGDRPGVGHQAITLPTLPHRG